MLSQNYLNKIVAAAASKGGNRFRDGSYTLMVKKLLAEQKNDGFMFIAEFEVTEARAIDPKVEPNQVGTEASLVYNLDTNKSAAGNVKALVLALLGVAEENSSAKDFESAIQALVGVDQVAKGTIIKTTTFRKPIKSRPSETFLGHNWYHVEQTDAEVAARRAHIK